MVQKERIRQQELGFKSWGGKRRGAGCKPKGPRPLVTHLPRPELSARHPVHVTLRLREGLPSLRNGHAQKRLEEVFAIAKERLGMRLVHYSIQTNHLHLMVEAKDRQALTLGVQGLSIRVARALNRHWKRVGKVFADRFHAHVLRTPKEVRLALAYVLHNARKHGLTLFGIDPFSSGEWFDGWLDDRWDPRELEPEDPVAPANTWLLRVGWRRHGLIAG